MFVQEQKIGKIKAYDDGELFCGIDTAQKMKFFINDFFNKCNQIRRKLRIWLQLLKKSLMKNLFFVQCQVIDGSSLFLET